MKLKHTHLMFESGSAWICENCKTYEIDIK